MSKRENKTRLDFVWHVSVRQKVGGDMKSEAERLLTVLLICATLAITVIVATKDICDTVIEVERLKTVRVLGLENQALDKKLKEQHEQRTKH